MSVDEIKWLSEIDHVLQRTDTYIGAAKPLTIETFVFSRDNEYNHEEKDDDDDNNDDDDEKEKEEDSKNSKKKPQKEIKRCGSLIKRPLSLVPGLIKIVDEVITNASDHHQRHPRSCTHIRVDVDQKNGKISVKNNGKGISSEMKTEYKMRAPTLIFGHFRTGTNFDDSKQRTWGGRNGLGVKLTNVWSVSFIVETVFSKKKFVQKWSNNMKTVGDPEITACTDDDYTKITFVPDYARFGLKKGLTDDIYAVLKKRVYDLAGVFSNLTVSWNGTPILIDSFSDYCNMYMANDLVRGRFEYADKAGAWQVILAFNPEEEASSVSFVNGLCTEEGGTHVEHVLDVVVPHLQEAVRGKISDKSLKVTPAMIKNALSVYVAALIPNPSFNTQTKTKLNTPKTEFSPVFVLPDSAAKKLKHGGLVSRLVEVVQRRHGSELGKSDKIMTKNTKIDKLEDADRAGKSDAEQCTLIITEGDSAKTFAMSGLTVVGQKYYGVFPIRGKVLNVRKATIKMLAKNKEFIHIKSILGLRNKQDAITKLRYGHVIIATDADSDGHHIAALIFNMFEYYWPELLQRPNFLSVFRTPIVKVWPKHKRNRISDGALWFYSDQEYKKWVLEDPNRAKKYDHKQYKGLGTSSPAEAKEYFEQLENHQIPLLPLQPPERKHIDMLFSKHTAHLRKKWIQEGTERLNDLPDGRTKMTFTEFLNERYVLHGIENCERTIPKLMDGLKPVQRKTLWTVMQKNIIKSMKVVSLSGAVINHMAYHHGDKSVNDAIVNMAQDFIGGNNNINLLMPEGQFGSRAEKGKDFASPRYINTRMAPIARFIFRKEDDAILKFLVDDGKRIEPEFFLPIVPMVLVNTSSGIGTGSASKLFPCNVHLLIRMLKERLSHVKPKAKDDEEKERKDMPLLTIADVPQTPIKTEPVPNTPTCTSTSTPKQKKAPIQRCILPDTQLQPFYRGFKGTIEYEKEADRFWCCGSYKISDVGNGMKRILIDEIPIQHSFTTYEDLLTRLRERDIVTQTSKLLLSYDDHVHFEVLVTQSQFDALVSKDFAPLKLKQSLTMNGTTFDERNVLVKYRTVQDVFDAFFITRLPFYNKRKEAMLLQYRAEQLYLHNMTRFIDCIIKEQLDVRAKTELIYDVLEEMKFDQLHRKKSKGDDDENDNEKEEDDDKKETVQNQNDREKGYAYLLKIPIIQQTEDHFMKLCAKTNAMNERIRLIEQKTPEHMWIEDLDELSDKLKQFEQQREQDILDEQKYKQKMKGKGKAKEKEDEKEKRGMWQTTSTKPLVKQEQKEKKKAGKTKIEAKTKAGAKRKDPASVNEEKQRPEKRRKLKD